MVDNVLTPIALIVYLMLVLFIGFWASRKTRTEEDFYLGGKKLPGWALALSERSTDMSAWLLPGAPGLAYATGLSAC